MNNSQFIEVSHVIEAGMKTYPGLPEPSVEVLMDHETSAQKYGGKAEFLISSLHLCGNTGTYVDAPLHRYRRGADLASLTLDKLAHLPVTLVSVPAGANRTIGVDPFRDAVARGQPIRGHAVLVRTDWSRHWRTPRYFEPNPYLTGAACEYLAEHGARFVGIDSLNVDDIHDLARPAHTVLLGAGIPVCEHLTNLQSVPKEGGFLHAVPIAWKGGATFPVRAYVMLDYNS